MFPPPIRGFLGAQTTPVSKQIAKKPLGRRPVGEGKPADEKSADGKRPYHSKMQTMPAFSGTVSEAHSTHLLSKNQYKEIKENQSKLNSAALFKPHGRPEDKMPFSDGIDSNRGVNRTENKEDAKSTTNKSKMAAYANKSPAEIEQLTKEIFSKTKDDSKKIKKEYGHVFSSQIIDHEALHRENKANVEKKQKFIKDVEKIVSHRPGIEKKIIVKDLKEFMYEKGQLKDFTVDELNILTTHLWNHDGWEALMEMVAASSNPSIKQNTFIMEVFAKCSLNSSKYYNPFIAISVCNLILSKDPKNAAAEAILGTAHESRSDFAQKMLEGLVDGNVNEDILENYKIAFPHDSEITEESVEKNYNETAGISRFYYEKTFSNSFDPRFGLRVMHNDLAARDEESAFKTAELVQLACLRDDVMNSNNFATVRAFVESCHLTGLHNDLLPEMEARLLTLCKTPKDTINALHGMNELSQFFKGKADKDPGAIKDVGNMIDRLTAHLRELSSTDQTSEVLKKREQELKEIPVAYTPATGAWNNKVYGYSSLSNNEVAGSLKFGGQLPSHEVNRYTKEFFNEILHQPLGKLITELPEGVDGNMTLNDIKDVDLTLELTNLFLREQFKTDRWNLEVITSDGHKEFDNITNVSIRLSGIPDDPKMRKEVMDDRTNLAMNLYSRLGDCRQHAQCKQLLMDIWYQNKANTIISELKVALDSGDAAKGKKCEKEFAALYSTKVKLWDMEVGYAPLDDPLNPDKYTKIEEHSANIKQAFDAEGNLKRVRISDPFYQETYPFKDCPIPIKKGKHSAETPYMVGTKVIDGTEYALIVKSAKYAGPKDDYTKRPNTENHYAGRLEQQHTAEDMLSYRTDIDVVHSRLHQIATGKHTAK
jgi:hypothetical protein